MARVSEEDLRVLVGAAESVAVSSFITDAHILLEDALVNVSHGHTEAKLAFIEKYLAGHLYVLTVEKGGLRQVKVGESQDTYHNLMEAGLGSTRFGAMAINADVSGTLASMAGPQKKAMFRVL